MVLSRVQQNEIFDGIRAHGLDPADFEWTVRPAEEGRGHPRLTHRPTEAYLEFSFLAGRGPLARVADVSVGVWISQVKANHEAPTSGGQIRKAQLRADAAAHPELLQPFTESERQQLEAGLEEIEAFVVNADGPPDPQRVEAVRGRFRYLRGAASRAAAKIDRPCEN